MFCEWINNQLLTSTTLPPGYPRSISNRTACRWLHDLGFQPVSHQKGVYIDGHEREDVVESRKDYLQFMEELQSTHLPPPAPEYIGPLPPPPPGSKYLVILDHDESVFYSNEDQSVIWAEPGTTFIKPKSKGSGIMVSDFIDEFEGALRLSDAQYEEAKKKNPGVKQEARAFLEVG